MSELNAPVKDEHSRLIIAVAQSQDRAAFVALFSYFAPRIKSYCLRRGTSLLMAEELAQETLLAVWRKAEHFDPAKARASTWIFTIARNLRVDFARRQILREMKIELPDSNDEVSPADHLLTCERGEKLHMALKALPPEQADIIRMSFFEEIPHPQIAEKLDIPLGTVKSRVRLAMNRLRSLLEDIR